MSRELALAVPTCAVAARKSLAVCVSRFRIDCRAATRDLEKVEAECINARLEKSEEVVAITKRLWAKFMEGADGRGMKREAVDKIIELSGGHVVCNLATLRHDPAKLQDVLNRTDECCYRCGELADDHAGFFGDISVHDIERAWCQTRDEMREACIKAAMLSGNAAAGRK